MHERSDPPHDLAPLNSASSSVLPHSHARRASIPTREATVTVQQEQSLAAAPITRGVYNFAEGSREPRDLLGGTSADDVEMTRVLGPSRCRLSTNGATSHSLPRRNPPIRGIRRGISDADSGL